MKSTQWFIGVTFLLSAGASAQTLYRTEETSCRNGLCTYTRISQDHGKSFRPYSGTFTVHDEEIKTLSQSEKPLRKPTSVAEAFDDASELSVSFVTDDTGEIRNLKTKEMLDEIFQGLSRSQMHKQADELQKKTLSAVSEVFGSGHPDLIITVTITHTGTPGVNASVMIDGFTNDEAIVTLAANGDINEFKKGLAALKSCHSDPKASDEKRLVRVFQRQPANDSASLR
jgi:hypothetical protein